MERSLMTIWQPMEELIPTSLTGRQTMKSGVCHVRLSTVGWPDQYFHFIERVGLEEYKVYVDFIKWWSPKAPLE